MSQVITGIVQEVKTISRGGRTAYDIVVGGETYGAGLYAPKCKQGDYVKFDLDDSRGYKNVARNSLKVSANKPPAEAVEEAKATAPKKTTTGGSVDTRQDTISRQSALNSAIAFMSLLSANDALGLPKSDTKGKRMEALELMLHKYEQQFYESNTGVKWQSISPSKPAQDEAEAEAPDPEADTSDDAWE